MKKPEMVVVGWALAVLVVVALTLLALSGCDGMPTYTYDGKVTSTIVTGTGNWGGGALRTIVTFDDGTSVTISGDVKLVIGKAYTITVRKYQGGMEDTGAMHIVSVVSDSGTSSGGAR